MGRIRNNFNYQFQQYSVLYLLFSLLSAENHISHSYRGKLAGPFPSEKNCLQRVFSDLVCIFRQSFRKGYSVTKKCFKRKASGQLANCAEAQLHFLEVSPAPKRQFLMQSKSKQSLSQWWHNILHRLKISCCFCQKMYRINSYF